MSSCSLDSDTQQEAAKAPSSSPSKAPLTVEEQLVAEAEDLGFDQWPTPDEIDWDQLSDKASADVGAELRVHVDDGCCG